MGRTGLGSRWKNIEIRWGYGVAVLYLYGYETIILGSMVKQLKHKKNNIRYCQGNQDGSQCYALISNLKWKCIIITSLGPSLGNAQDLLQAPCLGLARGQTLASLCSAAEDLTGVGQMQYPLHFLSGPSISFLGYTVSSGTSMMRHVRQRGIEKDTQGRVLGGGFLLKKFFF